jgi:hypothetical protein
MHACLFSSAPANIKDDRAGAINFSWTELCMGVLDL